MEKKIIEVLVNRVEMEKKIIKVLVNRIEQLEKELEEVYKPKEGSGFASIQKDLTPEKLKDIYERSKATTGQEQLLSDDVKHIKIYFKDELIAVIKKNGASVRSGVIVDVNHSNPLKTL